MNIFCGNPRFFPVGVTGGLEGLGSRLPDLSVDLIFL